MYLLLLNFVSSYFCLVFTVRFPCLALSVFTSLLRLAGWNSASEIIFQTSLNYALEQVAQGNCGCPIPRGIQHQDGCGSGQPGLVHRKPAHSRRVETWWSLWFFSTQAILWFYDSMILWRYDAMILSLYDSFLQDHIPHIYMRTHAYLNRNQYGLGILFSNSQINSNSSLRWK